MTQALAKTDWDAIRRRLAKATLAIDHVQLSPRAAQELLEERAKSLAQVPAEPPRATEVLEVIVFELADERFAVETRYVRAVARPSEITPVPGAPAFLAGVTNLRGEVLALMSLHELLGIPASPPAAPWVLVLGRERAEFGLLADEVQEVRTLALGELHPPRMAGARARGEYLRGVTAEALLVVDGAALLDDERLWIDEAERGA